MIICPRCGTKNNDNFNCCYNCGNPLNKQSEEIENEEQEEEILPQEDQEIEDSSDSIGSVYSSSAYRNQQTTVRTSSKRDSNPQPPKKKKNEVALSRAVAIAVIALVAVIVVWGTIKLLDNMFSGPITPSPSPTAPSTSHDPTLLYADVFSLSDTDINGDKFFKITIQTNGDKVHVMKNEYPVTNGEASLQLTQYDIYCTYRPGQVKKGEKFDVEIPITITREGFEDYTYNFRIADITTPMVPMELRSPTDLIATVYKTRTTLSFKALPGCEVFINGENYTADNFNSETGIFTMEILTPPQTDPYRYEIKIESNEYLTRTVYYELTRSTGHDPEQKTSLELDKIIYEAKDDNTVKVTGTFTGAQEDLTFYSVNNVPINVLSVNFNEDGSGAFEAVLECAKLCWAEIMIECRTDFGIHETIYVKNLSESLGGIGKVYTSSQGVNSHYSKLSGSKDYYAGWNFIIGYGIGSEDKAKVAAIKKVETGYAIAVNITPSKETETLVWVELLSDTFNKKVGDTIKIYATRSLSHSDTSICDGDMPRFLALKIQ